MSSENVLGHLVHLLKDQRESVKEDMVRGMMSFEMYHKQCGVVRGLDYAVQLIEDLAKQLERDDE